MFTYANLPACFKMIEWEGYFYCSMDHCGQNGVYKEPF